MTNGSKYLTLNVLALLTCILPPVAATLYYFPVWVQRGTEASVSGLSVFLLLVCCLPFIRTITEALKSPSAKTLWFLILVILWLLRTIIDEMIVVSAIGFISNLLGALLYKWRDRYAAPGKEKSLNE